MGIIVPRPAIRKGESRRIIAALAERQRLTAYDVIDLDGGESHGLYPTLDRALGCVEFDGLAQFQIWRGDLLVRSIEFDPAEAS